MRRKTLIGSVALGLLVVSLARALTLDSVTGTWSNVVGGANISFQTVGSENQVRWGFPATPAGNSGLGFTGVSVPSVFNPGDQVFLGTLRHFNNPIFQAASAVDLTIDLSFTDPLVCPSFSFTLLIDETPNVPPAALCPHPSIIPCSDRICFANPIPDQPFVVGRKEFTLEILGFTDQQGDIVTDFISEEGGTNSADLFGTMRVLCLPFMDIKPGSCPNSVNPGSKGRLPVSVLGGVLDPFDVDVLTILLSRADGVGGSVGHDRARIEDTATPFEGELCDCHELTGDGVDDLSLKFRMPAVTAALQLDALPFDTVVELVLTGQLFDGTDIEARDCIRIAGGGD